MKTFECTCCFVLKPESDFYVNKNPKSRRGRLSWCKKCCCANRSMRRKLVGQMPAVLREAIELLKFAVGGCDQSQLVRAASARRMMQRQLTIGGKDQNNADKPEVMLTKGGSP